MQLSALSAYDLALFQDINGARSPVLDAVMPFFSLTPMLWLAAILVLAWILRRYGRDRAIVVSVILLVTLGLADRSVDAIKHLAGRIRPLDALGSVHYRDDGIWQQRPADYNPPPRTGGSSFPSGHSANSMATILALAPLWKRRQQALCLIFPLLVGYSRIYLGKHYPTDVMVGWLLGAAAYAVARFVICPPLLRFLARKRLISQAQT